MGKEAEDFIVSRTFTVGYRCGHTFPTIMPVADKAIVALLNAKVARSFNCPSCEALNNV
jgi:hypothetical protein